MTLRNNRLTHVCRLMGVFLVVALAPSAAAFEVTDVSGQRHRLADLKGRWVVVNFWATWCAPCVKEIPEIAAFQKGRTDVTVLGIALDVEDEAKTQQFAAKVGHAYPLIFGNDTVEKQFGKVKGLPTTMVWNPRGVQVFNRMGTVTERSLGTATGR